MAHKTHGGNEVKESIVLICRMLKYSDIFSNLSPDHIRQAKFDKNEVVSVLFEVLLSLVDKRQSNHATVDMQEKNIRDVLISCRYPRIHFLFNKNGKLYSSREILLAISWFIHCDNTVEDIRLRALCPVNIAQLLANKHKTHQNCTNGKRMSMKTASLTEQTNYISWLVSQINLLKNQSISLESGNVQCKSKISVALKNEFIEDPLQLLILRYPSLGQEYERQLERKVLLLQACARWKLVQHVFWLWMDSVLASAPCEPRLSGTLPENNSLHPHTPLPMMNAFEEKLGKLQKILTKEKKTYLENANERREHLASLQPEQKAEIDREINLMRKLISDITRPVKLKHVKDGCVERHGHMLEKSIPLLQECERLSKMNISTAERLRTRRFDFKETLVGMSQKFSDIVLIPPDVPTRRVLS